MAKKTSSGNSAAIKDSLFKQLDHSFKGYVKHANGQEVEPGYRPDYVLRKGNDYIILECENSSSRKAFVGALIKAAHFLRHEKSGKLILIIVPKENTSSVSIAKHLKPYLVWISDKSKFTGGAGD